MMTEKEKLLKRLKDTETIDFNVSWGPDAHKLTEEEKCGVINNIFEEVERGNYEVSKYDGENFLDPRMRDRIRKEIKEQIKERDERKLKHERLS